MNLLWIIGVLAWSCCFAFGFNYFHGQSLLVFIVMFVAASCLMGITLYMLNKTADKASGGNRANAALKERLCLALLAVMICVSIVYVARFITIQTKVSPSVKVAATERISKLRVLFAGEDVEGSYRCYVAEMAETYKNQLRGLYYSKGTIDTKVAEFKDEMHGKDEFNELAYGADEFLSSAERVINYWIPWDVQRKLSRLDMYSKDWPEELVTMSKGPEWVNRTGDVFKPDIPDDEPLAPRVTEYSVSNFGMLPILLIAAMIIFMIIPYAKIKDWGAKGPGGYKGTGMTVYNPDKKNVLESSGETTDDDLRTI